MKRYLFCVIFLLAASSACFCFLSVPRQTGQRKHAQKNVRASAPDVNMLHHTLLFPGLDAGAVTAVSVSAPDRRFEFLREQPHEVSVNGRKADSEIFCTLVSQIAEIPVSPAEPFVSSDEPALHLTVVSGGRQYQAAFYAASDGSLALVRSGAGDAPGYHQTAGWRVGTLMLTCEGTRIQDERGRETPAN